MTAATKTEVREADEANRPPRRIKRLTGVVVVLAVALLGVGVWLIYNLVVTGSEVAPFHAIPDGSVAVTGTATCSFSRPVEGLTVECDLDLNDPRVSGTEIHPGLNFYFTGAGGKVWVANEATITNPEGTWKGSAQAAEDLSGIPSGEAHYFGEGAYEGLEFHYYFFHPVLIEPAQVRGWISGD